MFSKRQRLIFTFFDGIRDDHRADPVVLQRRLASRQPVLLADWKVMSTEAPVALKERFAAKARVVEAIHEIFATKPLDDEGGITEDEAITNLVNFIAWTDKVKKNISSTPTSAAATSAASSVPTEVSPDDGPPTEPYADCGSIDGDFVISDPVT